MPELLCANCDNPLAIEVDPQSENEDSKSTFLPESVPDDVELNCGCHFHWECFLEEFDLESCPSCDKNILSSSSSGQHQVLCIIRNEGGVQNAFDILPSAIEEQYLAAHPEERIGHAYLHFCREGDVDAIAHLIKEAEASDADDHEDEIEVLSYCGTIEGAEGSGLHVAIRYGCQEVAWLLLAMASTMDWANFPPAVLQALESLGLAKEDRKPSIDIRSLKDSEGRTPHMLAEHLGGSWSVWVKERRLQP